MKASWRNIAIYVAGAYALSTLGCFLVASGHDVGGLVFVASPILMAVSLRAFGGEGWKTAGFRPHFAGHAFDYALAVLVFPVFVALSLTLGAGIGTLTLSDGFLARYLPAILVMLPITMLYAVFEEFGWRGYLEPQLEILGVSDLKRHLLVGVIWAIWHVPYLMTFGNIADIPLYLFMPIYLIETLAMAVWYGVSRKRTNSVWPAVIAHGGANAIMWPLVMTADLVQIHNGLWISPRPDSALSMCLLIAVAAFIWHRR